MYRYSNYFFKWNGIEWLINKLQTVKLVITWKEFLFKLTQLFYTESNHAFTFFFHYIVLLLVLYCVLYFIDTSLYNLICPLLSIG